MMDLVPPIVSPGVSDAESSLAEEKAKLENISLLPRTTSKSKSGNRLTKELNGAVTVNKFVRRLHDMLTGERGGGVVGWELGGLIIHDIDIFANTVLPKYYNTRNFKTFRRQLNYYGFLHVKNMKASGSATTAHWVNQELAKDGNGSISGVLKLKRNDAKEASKKPEARQKRKTEAAIKVKAHSSTNSVQEYPVPKYVHCDQEQTSYENVGWGEDSFRSIDPVIDQAAGLLLSLSRTPA